MIMIVIHIGILEDSSRLDRCYAGADDIVLLHNKKRDEIDKVLSTNKDPLVMLLGHGSPNGLFGVDETFAIDSESINLLKDRTIIGLWCYASEFADKYKLHGFFTSMFISNIQEAMNLSFFEGTYEELETKITEQLDIFCYRIRSLMIRKEPMNTWVEYLQSVCDKNIPFVRFNYEALSYYE